MQNKPLVSFIIPVFNAESFIYNNLKQFSNYCLNSNFNSEIIVVNDGSNDKTDEIINDYLVENKNDNLIKYINLTENVGKGSAIKKGIFATKGQFIVFTDCDLPYSFHNIDNVVDKLTNGLANVIIANRMHKDSHYVIKSGNLSYIYIRHTSGRVYNFLIRLLCDLDIADTQAGLKGFDRESAELIFSKMTISGFSFDIDILVCAKVHKKTIHTIPIHFNYETEMSTVNFVKQTFIMTTDLMRIFIKRINGGYRR